MSKPSTRGNMFNKPQPKCSTHPLNVPLATIGDKVKLLPGLLTGETKTEGEIVEAGLYPNGECWYRIRINRQNWKITNHEIDKVLVAKDAEQYTINLEV